VVVVRERGARKDREEKVRTRTPSGGEDGRLARKNRKGAKRVKRWRRVTVEGTVETLSPTPKRLQ